LHNIPVSGLTGLISIPHCNCAIGRDEKSNFFLTDSGSALSPLLFVIVMEAISREFRVALPWELLYADDLAVIAETIKITWRVKA